MTKKLAVINYKGGTGKTSTAVSLAHGLSIMGKKVLLVDIDPQGSVGYYLGIDEPQITLYDALLNIRPLSACVINARPNLDIIVSNERLFAAELKLSGQPRREHILSQRLESATEYDFIILDCPPSMNLLNQNALSFAENVIIPVSMEYLALVGIRQLLKNIQIVNRMLGKELKICKVVPTFFDPRNQKTKHIMESLERVFPGFVSSPIRVSVALSEAPGFRKTIYEFDPKSKAASDYMKLTQEVLAHG
ncbi:ParA family protein [bacterium]|nr:ParA family protein [bacterium]